MTYDPEVPRGYQDEDIEMYEAQEKAREALAERKAGRCRHGWSGPAVQPWNGDWGADRECYHCGYVGPAKDFEGYDEDHQRRGGSR